MAKPSDVNNLISSYQSEQADIQNYQDNPDPSTASIGGSITENVEQTIPFQNADGTWSTETNIEYGVFATAGQREDESIIGEVGRRLDRYGNILQPLDDQMITINANINANKAGIITQVNAAVSAGCSVVDHTGSSSAILFLGTSTNPAAGSVSVGIGSDIFSDTVRIKQYNNITNFNSAAPFESDEVNTLSIGSTGEGYRNIHTNDDSINGVNIGRWKTVNPWLATQISGSNATCQDCIDKINALAVGLGTMRPLRDQFLNDVNVLKEARIDDELAYWAIQRESVNVDNRKQQLAAIIGTLDNLNLDSAGVIQSDLVFHYDVRNNSSYLAGGSDWKDLTANTTGGIEYDAVMVGDRVSFNNTDQPQGFEFTGATIASKQGLYIRGFRYYSGNVDSIPLLTIETWVKPSNVTSGRVEDQRVILSFDREANFKFSVGNHADSGSAGKPCLSFTNETGTHDVKGTGWSGDLRDNNWHQVAVTFQSQYVGVSTSSEIKFYVDGVNVSSHTGNWRPIGDHNDLSRTPRFGWIGNDSAADTENGDTDTDHMWMGKMGVLRMYNQVLTPSEINMHFEVHRGQYGL